MGKVIQAAWMFQAKRFLQPAKKAEPLYTPPIAPFSGINLYDANAHQTHLELLYKYNTAYPQLDKAIENHPIQKIIKTIMDEPPKGAA